MREYCVIAVDFDGTLAGDGVWPEVGEPNLVLIRQLKARRAAGDKLILWTCRSGEALEVAVAWAAQQGLKFDAVNDNLPEVVATYGNNSRKISCDYYIDDKSVLPDNFPSVIVNGTR